jgi:hypothetical protein
LKYEATTAAALRWHRAPIFAQSVIWMNFYGNPFSGFFNGIMDALNFLRFGSPEAA